MNRTFRFFIATFCIAPMFSAGAAVQIKKATPVASSSSSGSSSTASLVPNAIGLVSGIMTINAKQNEMSAECEPTKQEMDFVDNTMKEWAKTGQMTLKEIQGEMTKKNFSGPCRNFDGYDKENSFQTSGITPCYNFFNDKGMVWNEFPRTGKGTYCKDGTPNNGCSGKNKVTVSNMYDLFNVIDFDPADYTQSEATMAAKLLSKIESCSPSKLSAKKKALWGDFLVSTAGGLGKKTDTSSIMQQVGNISSSGGIGAIGSLGNVASQLMNK
ncbi:MAG TPA: hypothetical protein PKJ33_02450 [Alphaproteobacteria bacterium]|nr:hypothetical protein [Alphaproteobacteria bacterium]